MDEYYKFYLFFKWKLFNEYSFLAINNITTENKTDIVTNLYLTNINQLNIIYLSINYLKNILTIPH